MKLVKKCVTCNSLLIVLYVLYFIRYYTTIFHFVTFRILIKYL